MSRSYKHTPVFKGGKSKHGKRYANKVVRRQARQNPENAPTGKSNAYRKAYESWNVCDYRFWGGPIWREESYFNLRGRRELWEKCYRRK